ncbi:MAG: glycosyltransferase family 4 protein [Candidatus Moranbacteria bacterium]|nr:glycosyltransferase family 4 protein [Candidatus Moranbacteria bacterium]
MKKILFVSRPIAPPWDEASKNFAYHLAKETAVSNKDIEIHIMTKGVLDDLPKNVICHDVYTSSERDFGAFQKIRSVLFQLMQKNKFDIIQYFFTPTKASSVLIDRFLKGESKTIQTIATLREDLFSDDDIKELIFGDIVTTYSDYAKERLEGLGVNNVKKIYPGIDLSDYSPREKDENLLSEFGFSKDDFIINFTGEYIRLGAMDSVIESFIKVSKKIPNAKLSLAVRVKNEKDAKKKEAVIKELQGEGLLGRVAFHDTWHRKMSDLYNMCDISLFPVQNMYGKFDVPLAVIETMACKKAMIISDIPILQEFSTQNNSVLISRDNPIGLADTIIDLFENKSKREEIAQNAATFARENFDIKKSAQKYADLYKNL